VHGEDNCTGDVTRPAINNPLTAVCLPKRKGFPRLSRTQMYPNTFIILSHNSCCTAFRFFSHYIETTCFGSVVGLSVLAVRSVTISAHFSSIYADVSKP